jgi:hypothetical protein
VSARTTEWTVRGPWVLLGRRGRPFGSRGLRPAGSLGRCDTKREQEEAAVFVHAIGDVGLHVGGDLHVEEAALSRDAQVEGLVGAALDEGELRVEPADDLEGEARREEGARQILGVLAGGVAEGDVGFSHGQAPLSGLVEPGLAGVGDLGEGGPSYQGRRRWARGGGTG